MAERRVACEYPGCGAVSGQRLCPTHRREVDRASAAARGYGRRWRRIRLSVLRQQPLCAADGCTRSATDVHHRVPLDAGGTNHRDNLVGLCHQCHAAITAGRVVTIATPCPP